jgi:hypothetical protein
VDANGVNVAGDDAPVWIVLARRLGDTITVAGEPEMVATLVLDADTGLVRGVGLDVSAHQGCLTAARAALTAPAGPLPPQVPATVVYDDGPHADELLAALREALARHEQVQLVAAPAPAEAHEIVDSMVGHLVGREQPDEPADPQDWAALYGAADRYLQARPWQLWSDADYLDLTVTVDGEQADYLAVVLGQAGVQHGLAIYPDGQVPTSIVQPGVAPHVPPGAIMLWLDTPAKLPQDYQDKARRYGWPDGADLAPLPARALHGGVSDLDRTGARRLTVALIAVVTHRRPRSGPDSTGVVELHDGDAATFVIREAATAAQLPLRPRPPVPVPAPMRTTRLRVTVQEVTPAVVRIIDVPAAATLPEVHILLQAALGWTDSHLYEFEVGEAGVRYVEVPPGASAADSGPGATDSRTVPLRTLPERFLYRYDLGDDWLHDLEKLGAGGPMPGCLDGEGACPPEDCGGPGGYAELLEALADPEHPEHDHLSSWAARWSPDWTADDLRDADERVRATAGLVPRSVQLLLGLVGDGIKLTAGGRLPRRVVHAMVAERPNWAPFSQTPSSEDDVFPLTALHHTLRRVGLLRLAHGTLSPTAATRDEVATVRKLRSALPSDQFNGILAEVTTAHLAAHGPLTDEQAAAATYPWLARWTVDGRPVTPADVERQLAGLSATLEGLDLLEDVGLTYEPGPSAETLLPRATALAHHLRTARA